MTGKGPRPCIRRSHSTDRTRCIAAVRGRGTKECGQRTVTWEAAFFNIFRWSSLSYERKSALFGAALWFVVGMLGLSFDWRLWQLFFLLASLCVALALFADEKTLKRALGWASLPWPFS